MPSPVNSLLQGPVNVPGAMQQFNGFFAELTQDSFTAFAGGGQASATQLTGQTNRVSTVATAADSVMLPQALPGLELMVINDAANPMQVFGFATDTIDTAAAATGVSQMGKSMVIYTCVTAGNWRSEGLATGWGPFGLMTESSANALTALAGGGQAGATQIKTMQARFTVVVTAGDSGLLPATTQPGLAITVVNSAANSMTVFPATGDQINALGANAGFALAGGQTATFVSCVAGQWNATYVPSHGQTQEAYGTNTTTVSATLTAANVSGGSVETVLNLTGTLGGAANAQLPTVAALVAVIPNAAAGQSYRLRIINSSSATFTWTITTNTGWTLTGTMTIAQNTWRDFIVTLTSLTAATLQQVGTGTNS